MQDQKETTPEAAELTQADLAAIHDLERDIIDAVARHLDTGRVGAEYAIQALMLQGTSLLMVAAGDSGASLDDVVETFDDIVASVREKHLKRRFTEMTQKAQELRASLQGGDKQ